jgi:hypothetical protein
MEQNNEKPKMNWKKPEILLKLDKEELERELKNRAIQVHGGIGFVTRIKGNIIYPFSGGCSNPDNAPYC